MIEMGDTLTINHEIFKESSEIVFEGGEKVIIRDVWIEEAHYSRLYPNIWIPEKLKGIMLVGYYCIWKPETFKELKENE